ncbi:MAG: hypothetical protein ACETWQ_03205 [Phycisphaerae bacterium]
MKTVLYLLCVAVVLSGLLSSSALALTPLGPPKAGLKQKQHNLGFVFASSEMNLKVSGYGLSETLPDIESNAYLVKAGYGLSDGCELYTLLGLADFSAEDFDGDSQLAWGFGTKFTVAQKNSVTWGGLFQMCSLSAEGSVSGDVPGYGWQTIDLDVQLFDIQIAFGPTYTQESFSIYGGPFLHFIEGDMDVSLLGVTGTVDVEQESEFGGYIGAQFDLAESSSLFVEYQVTGDASAIAAGFVWRF